MGRPDVPNRVILMNNLQVCVCFQVSCLPTPFDKEIKMITLPYLPLDLRWSETAVLLLLNPQPFGYYLPCATLCVYWC